MTLALLRAKGEETRTMADERLNLTKIGAKAALEILCVDEARRIARTARVWRAYLYQLEAGLWMGRKL